jgi:predicted CDP-diglyceride synthetase/phosphatidate cytidylyltransferase
MRDRNAGVLCWVPSSQRRSELGYISSNANRDRFHTANFSIDEVFFISAKLYLHISSVHIHQEHPYKTVWYGRKVSYIIPARLKKCMVWYCMYNMLNDLYALLFFPDEDILLDRLEEHKFTVISCWMVYVYCIDYVVTNCLI